MRRSLVLVLLVGVVLGSLSGVAVAAGRVLEVSGPAEVAAGDEVEISVTVREATTGEPVAGVPVVFFADAFFAGVTGEIRLGSAESNSIGVATFATSFSVRGVHQVRVEIEGDAETEPASVNISVGIGAQIIESEVGVSIPGVGAWMVTAVIGAVWLIMIVAALWMVRVARSGRAADEEEPAAEIDEQPRRRRRRFELAPVAAGAIVLLALGIVTLLMRSPDTHHNFDPQGYDRSPVAYLDAAYIYPGVGLSDTALSGNALDDGRALFLKLGCAGCHGLNAQGAAAARSPAFATRQWLGTVVRTGLPGGMPAYGAADVSDADLDAIHVFLFDARDALSGEAGAGPPATVVTPTTTTTVEPTGTPTTTGGDVQAAPTFADVQQVLQPNCGACHGTFGGWSAADYDSVVGSGDNGPAVRPGDPDGSVLVQKLRGTQTFGGMMPPSGSLAEADIALIIDWIEGGAAP